MANTASTRLLSSPSFSFMSGASFPACRFSRQSRFEEKSAEAVQHPKTSFLGCQKSGCIDLERAWRYLADFFARVRVRSVYHINESGRAWEIDPGAINGASSVGSGQIFQSPTIRPECCLRISSAVMQEPNPLLGSDWATHLGQTAAHVPVWFHDENSSCHQKSPLPNRGYDAA